MNVHSPKASGLRVPIRRRHQKSGTGCTTCKNKKVKVGRLLAYTLNRSTYRSFFSSIPFLIFRLLSKLSSSKCDEVKPSCQYCARRLIQCTYAGPKSPLPPKPSPPASNADSQRTPSTPSERPNITTPAVFTSSCSVVIPAGLSPNHPFGPGGQWTLSDLELMHFYTASTSLTLSNAPSRRNVWQSVVPQIAFSHDFLLHGLLAFAALHLPVYRQKGKTAS